MLFRSLFFKNNKKIFKINNYSSKLVDINSINYRFNLDYPEDHEVIDKLFKLKKDKSTPFYSNELFEISAKNPKLMALNSNMEKKYEQKKLKEHLLSITTTRVNK
mgnify:FL=1